MNTRLSATRRAVWSAFKRWWVLIALGTIYVYAFPYFGALRHANELPRILTTVQLAERATFRLDERLDDLGSRADVSTTPSGHYFQNKAPGLSIIALPVYYPLQLGYQLVGRRPPMMLATWLLRVLLVTVPAIAFLVFFRRVAQRFASAPEAQNGALVAYALGSMALPYGILFMSHALAASLVGVAFAISVATVRDRVPEIRAALGVGALLGLAMLTEYQALFGAVMVAGYLVWGVGRRWRVALALVAASLPFVAALALYHRAAFGSAFRTGYSYSVDPANRVGIMGIVGFSKESLAQLFVGIDNGLLLLSPWVLLAVVGGVVIARDVEARARVGREALVAAIVAVVYLAFVAALHPHFGRAGWSVGPRYLAVAMPFLAWLAASGLDFCLRHTALRVPAFALVLMGVGIHLLAATTYPHWPLEFQNPLFEVSVRLLREGHAPHSLGTLVGLRGVLSLAPLYLGALALVVYLLTPKRQYLFEVGLAVALAAFTVSRYDRLAVTPKQTAAVMWKFVESTAEP